MNPWELVDLSGNPSIEDTQAQQGVSGVPGNVNLWAGVPDASQVDPTGAPSIRGKILKFEGHWEKVPSGKQYVRDRVWYE